MSKEATGECAVCGGPVYGVEGCPYCILRMKREEAVE